MACAWRATTPRGAGLVARSLPWRRALGAAQLIAVCGHRARRSLAPRRDPCRRGQDGGRVA
eukprot:scaffold37205_cov51-Phaeocystis_antarctica.AAC.1